MNTLVVLYFLLKNVRAGEDVPEIYVVKMELQVGMIFI